jgi:hypothetical protein
MRRNDRATRRGMFGCELKALTTLMHKQLCLTGIANLFILMEKNRIQNYWNKLRQYISYVLKVLR